MEKKFKPVHEGIQQAQVRFAQGYLYFAPHLYRMKFLEDPLRAGTTMGIDKYWRVYYNPKWVEACNAAQNVFNLYHELKHPLLDYWGRNGGRNWKRWNIAHDLEINSGLLREINAWAETIGRARKIKCPMEVPPGVMLPEVFGFPEGLLAEVYYKMLEQLSDKDIEEAGSGREHVCGVAESGEEGEGDPSPEGKISEAEGEIMKRKIAEDLLAHKKDIGFLPADLEFFVQRTLHPQVNWKRELRSGIRTQMIKTMGRDDFTYMKKSRRDIPGIVLPGMQAHLPVACVVIDSSGSMGRGKADDLDVAMSETAEILKFYKGRFFVHVLAFDTHLAAATKAFSIDAVKLGGGGGTDMVKAFDAAMECKPKPDVIIMITDGETMWPSVPPSAKSIIVCTTKAETPAWAKTIRVETGEVQK